MHAVIVGAGRVGVPLARWLVSAGHEVAVVDEDRARCSTLDESLGAVSVPGDGTDAGVLARAGTNRADVLIATTRADDINLVACQLAKHRFGVAKTISVVNNGEHKGLFGMLGIDVNVDVAELVLGRIQEGLTSREMSHLMPASGGDGRSLLAIKIPGDTGVEGRKLKDMPLPEGTLIPLVIRNNGVMSIPGENTLINAGDEVVAVATPQTEEELRDILIEGNAD